MLELYNKTVREIAVEFPRTTRVFEEFKIDYCCAGERNFGDACQFAGVAPFVVSQKIEAELAGPDKCGDLESPERKNASDLADYIVERHHVLTTNEIARLTNLVEKVCRKHGARHSELFDIQTIFLALAGELAIHMRKEEMVLFPYIKTLYSAVSGNGPAAEPHFVTVRNPVRRMMTEHDAAGDFLQQMRQLSKNYALPEGACPSFRALYYGFEDLEKDLHRHIHLENNVLFPRAIELEQKVFGKAAGKNGADYVRPSSCN